MRKNGQTKMTAWPRASESAWSLVGVHHHIRLSNSRHRLIERCCANSSRKKKSYGKVHNVHTHRLNCTMNICCSLTHTFSSLFVKVWSPRATRTTLSHYLHWLLLGKQCTSDAKRQRRQSRRMRWLLISNRAVTDDHYHQQDSDSDW